MNKFKIIGIILIISAAAFGATGSCEKYGLGDKAGSSGDNQPKPDAPIDLVAGVYSSTQINLSWKGNSDVEQGFKLERKAGAGGVYSQIAVINANVEFYYDAGLTYGVTYYYRLKAYNKTGDGKYSAETSATTCVIPPSNLAAGVISLTQINLSWRDNTVDEDGFKIERKTGLAGTYAQIATVGTDIKLYSDNTISAYNTYYYRVRAFNSYGDSEYSNEANNSNAYPNAPITLTASLIPYSQVDLSWVDSSTNETGFKIERKTGAGGTYAQIGTVGVDVALYPDTVITEGNTYYYRVLAYNAIGDSEYSNEVSITVMRWLSISGGDNFMLALKTDGTLWSSGRNHYGQLGLGDASPLTKTFPTLLGSDNNWSIVDAGAYHSLAVKTDNTFWSWGSNDSGQLGVGISDYYRTEPILVNNSSDWLIVSGGGNHSISLKTNGTVQAWGYNAFGQLGLGDLFDRNTPTLIGTDSNWSAVTAGESHTMALKTNNTLWAWGRNNFGQLGDGTVVTRNTPRAIGTQSDWYVIAAGFGHTLSVKTNRTMWSWGQNNYGQLGLGDTFNRFTPTQIGTYNDWMDVEAGYSHTIAIKTNNTIWTWGNNNYGQLGLGDTIIRFIPYQVGTSADWSKIEAGNYASYGLKTDGVMWSWGFNEYGQLGLGDSINRNTPSMVGQ